jgi:hypothetical protein
MKRMSTIQFVAGLILLAIIIVGGIHNCNRTL